MAYFPTTTIQATDSPSIDAFSRWRVSNPTDLFHSTFEYNLNPLLYEQTITGTGSITHDATNSCADFATTGGGVGSAIMQSYKYFRYQPGKSHLIFLTFRLGAALANVTRRIGIFDANDGFYLEQTGVSTVNLVRLSSTSTTTSTVPQSSWNIDPMDGGGPSGITLDLTKCQILVIDAQWLGVGRARIGFDIDGIVYYVHEFLHANSVTDVYMRTLSLPIRASLSTAAAVEATMSFICASVNSEGGANEETGYDFSYEGTVTAGNGTQTHILSIQPSLTYNSITNRVTMILNDIDITVTGNAPVKWEVCIGTAISGTTTFTNVNSAYSAMDYNIAGTLSGTPGIVIKSGYCASTANVKATVGRTIASKYPITLDAAGAARIFGRVTVLVTGLGGSSASRVVLSWREIR